MSVVIISEAVTEAIGDLIDEKLAPIKEQIRQMQYELTSITEFDETHVRALIKDHDKIRKFLREAIWLDTKVDGLEQFLADIVPEEHRSTFENRINRLEQLSPAANSAFEAALLGYDKTETESQRLRKEEDKKLGVNGTRVEEAIASHDGAKNRLVDGRYDKFLEGQ